MFDSIRPYRPEELPAAFARMAAVPQFKQMVRYIFPDKPYEALVERMMQCRDNLEFQKTFCYPFLKGLLAKASRGLTTDFSAIDVRARHTFVSNHRDIVMDPALLCVALIEAGSDTTVEIAIGDNLLAAPWIEDLVKVNKAFIVKRSAAMREMLTNSKELSGYIHDVIATGRDNVWIAQRQGRAKDSDDRTQTAILKMMAMAGQGSVIDRIKALHIVPLAISYEYDPCDYLKAAEYQLRRDQPDWQKTKADDVLSMQTGIMGWKGHITYRAAECIDTWLDTLDPAMPKTELFDIIAQHIDQAIHSRYEIYPSNEQAAAGATEPSEFTRYIDTQLVRIDIPGRDEAYLRERLMTMYANPLRNKQATL